MSCNGCRVLRKGCSETCILRPCLQWMDTAEAQGHATVFVAKFFGRAGLMSFISNVPENQRPALFQSLLYEACGRTVNPVSGAVGLLWTGNWHVCQAAVETVLRGGTLRPIPEFLVGAPSSPTTPDTDEVSEVFCPPNNPTWQKNQVATAAAVNVFQDLNSTTTSPPRFTNSKRRRPAAEHDHHHHNHQVQKTQQLDLSLTPPVFLHASPPSQRWLSVDKQRPGTPSMNSEGSATTVSFESGLGADNYRYQTAAAAAVAVEAEPALLNLFV